MLKLLDWVGLGSLNRKKAGAALTAAAAGALVVGQLEQIRHATDTYAGFTYTREDRRRDETRRRRHLTHKSLQ